MADKEELKPCPFCGFEMNDEYLNQCSNTDTEEDPRYILDKRNIVVCPICVASTREAETWNHRSCAKETILTSTNSNYTKLPSFDDWKENIIKFYGYADEGVDWVAMEDFYHCLKKLGNFS